MYQVFVELFYSSLSRLWGSTFGWQRQRGMVAQAHVGSFVRTKEAMRSCVVVEDNEVDGEC